MEISIFFTKKSLFKSRQYFLYYINILFLMVVSGCGYVIEGSNPLLPNDAKTIAILPIQNQTFIAGLETDLSEQLNRLLRSNSSLKISPAHIADLHISITLLKINTNTYGLSKEQITSGIKATIQCETNLLDRRINKNIWDSSIITVNLTESLENEMENTSGISISGKTRQVIKLLATKIYARLFNTF